MDKLHVLYTANVEYSEARRRVILGVSSKASCGLNVLVLAPGADRQGVKPRPPIVASLVWIITLDGNVMTIEVQLWRPNAHYIAVQSHWGIIMKTKRSLHRRPEWYLVQCRIPVKKPRNKKAGWDLQENKKSGSRKRAHSQIRNPAWDSFPVSYCCRCPVLYTLIQTFIRSRVLVHRS